jgi:hypothetical protein
MVYKGNQSPIPSGGAGGGFKIHAYGKSELAMMYFPGDSKELALKKLRCWFAKNKNLKHFVSREKKYFTPKQVKIIIEELGEPDD